MEDMKYTLAIAIIFLLHLTEPILDITQIALLP